MGRDIMNAALQARFVPHLRSMGFKGSLPHFRRISDQRIDLLTVQFDQRGGAFVIEIARCDREGITTQWGKTIPPARVTAHDLHPRDRHRLGSPGPGQDGRWFRYGDETTIDAAADEATAALAEADEWWSRR